MISQLTATILLSSLLAAKVGKKSAVTTAKFVNFKSFLQAKWVTLFALRAFLTSIALVFNFLAHLREKMSASNFYYKNDNNFSHSPTRSWLINLYFWFGFSILLVRVLTMLLIASQVASESREPLEVMNRIPANEWCQEAERLFRQIRSQKIAFSGNGLFSITRKAIVPIASTIVTYAL